VLALVSPQHVVYYVGIISKRKKIQKTDLPSARFIWMANKETDDITAYPTTFLETAGTQTKLALNVARKYGCVLEEDLPMSGQLSTMSRAAFYTKAAKLRISSYHNIGTNIDDWRRWLAFQGPILTRVGVDKNLGPGYINQRAFG